MYDQSLILAVVATFAFAPRLVDRWQVAQLAGFFVTVGAVPTAETVGLVVAQSSLFIALGVFVQHTKPKFVVWVRCIIAVIGGVSVFLVLSADTSLATQVSFLVSGGLHVACAGAVLRASE
jgi:hypothetical protein